MPERAAYGQVVVGVDFGPGSLAAIEAARRLTVARGRITLVNVVLIGEDLALRADANAQLSAQTQSMWLLDRERRLMLAAPGGVAHTIATQSIVAGSAGRGLTHVARHLGADLIVVGQPRPRRWRWGRPLCRALAGDGAWRVVVAGGDGTLADRSPAPPVRAVRPRRAR